MKKKLTSENKAENKGRQKALNFIVNTLLDYAEEKGLSMPVFLRKKKN